MIHRRVALGPQFLLLALAFALENAGSSAGARAAEAPSQPVAVVDGARQQSFVIPTAERTLEGLPADAPSIMLKGKTLSVDGVVAGSIAEPLAKGQIRRLEGLSEALKARRRAWESAHPGVQSPNYVLLWLDVATPLTVVKSILQTAALAGYPEISFAVHPKGDPRAVAHINIDAIVPEPSLAGRNDPFALQVNAVEGNELSFAWEAGGEAFPSIYVAERVEPGASAFPVLASKLQDEWTAHGGHRSPVDRGFDHAVLQASNSLTLQTMVALVDAIYSPMREFEFEGKAERVSAFNVALGGVASQPAD